MICSLQIAIFELQSGLAMIQETGHSDVGFPEDY